MLISNLTFVVTEKCNFNCTYCPQTKDKRTLPLNLIETAVDFFYPFLKKDKKIHVGFYGGEPLLAFEQIQHATLLLLGKNQTGHKDIEFSLTTNGSLLTDNMLEFFNRSRFTLTLSFDGLAQEVGRENGSLEKTLRAMKRIQEHPDINFEINSVFSPLTVPILTESLHFIIKQGGPEITFNLSTLEYWNPEAIETLKKELQRLRDFLAIYYKENGKIPVKNFQPQADDVSRGVFRCSAGNEQISLAPDGKVWGCFLFHDYFKSRQGDPQYWDYCFGDLADFITNYRNRYVEKLVNYCQLQQDLFQVEGEFCFLCKELPGCMVCPVYAAYSTGVLGKITCQHCALMKIQNGITREPF